MTTQTPAPVGATTTTWLGRMWASILNVVQHEAWPILQNLFHTIQLDAQTALAPIVEAGLAELEADLPLLLTQGPAGFLKAFNALVAKVWQQVEGTLQGVTMTDVLTASHAGLVNLQAKLAPPAAAA